MNSKKAPGKQGLYNPVHEHDACGIGFVVNMKGKQSNKIIRQAITVLDNLDHRGATGSEPNSGDGAGILLQIPHNFLKESCAGLNIDLPGPGKYGVGMVFFPGEREDRLQCEKIIEKVIEEEGLEILGWRKVPTDNSKLGKSARAKEPSVRQLFIKKDDRFKSELDFERSLYIARRRVTKAIDETKFQINEKDSFYIASLSTRTIIYKGMLTSKQLEGFTLICGIHVWNRRWRWFTRDSAPIHSQAGSWLTPIAMSFIMVKLTPCAAIKTGCTRGRISLIPNCLATI